MSAVVQYFGVVGYKTCTDFLIRRLDRLDDYNIYIEEFYRVFLNCSNKCFNLQYKFYEFIIHTYIRTILSFSSFVINRLENIIFASNIRIKMSLDDVKNKVDFKINQIQNPLIIHVSQRNCDLRDIFYMYMYKCSPKQYYYLARHIIQYIPTRL